MSKRPTDIGVIYHQLNPTWKIWTTTSSPEPNPADMSPPPLPLNKGLRTLIIKNLPVFESWIRDRLVEKYKHRAEEEICNRLINAGFLRGDAR